MIPKTIYFCYKTLDHMPLHTQIWKDLNPEYEIRHYDNEMCAEFLEKEFSPLHRNIFDFLQDGPIKAD